MSQFSQRLIFGKKDILLQDSEGGQIRTFQKSDFLISGGRYRVTESLLGKLSEGLLIEIEAPIEVEVTFEAQINANVKGAIVHANADGAIANANVKDAIAYADAKGAIANAKRRGAEAHANVEGAEAYADAEGAIANADADGAEAYANAPGAEIHATVPGALAIPLS